METPAQQARPTGVSPHIVPARVYFAVFAALIALTGLTVAIAFVDLGLTNNLMALGIATAKALLVVLFFMELRFSSRLTWIAVAGGLFFLGVLILFTMSDALSRGWLGFPGR